MNPFMNKLKNPNNTTPMSKNDTKIFAMILIAENTGRTVSWDKLSEKEKTFLMKVIIKRIDVLKLPIKFTVEATLAAEILANGNVGKTVTILIDCLNKYINKTITANMIAELYPYGFYNDEVFMDYIDNYIKPQKIPYSEIY